MRILLFLLLVSFNLSAQRSGFFFSTVRGTTPTPPDNFEFIFTDDVDREGGACEAVIRDGVDFEGHFTPPTGFSVTEWRIERTTHSKTVAARGTGNTVTKTFAFTGMDSCNVYDLWAEYTDGSDTYEYLSTGEFFVLPAIPASYDATWNSSGNKDGAWTDRSDYAINLTGSINGAINSWWWRSDDPTDPVHIVANSATITVAGVQPAFKATAYKNVILDGCTDESSPYGLVVNRSSGAQNICFELQATETSDATHITENFWVVGVKVDGGPSPSTGVTGFRIRPERDATNHAGTYSLDGFLMSNTFATGTWEEAYYIGQSSDGADGNGRYHPQITGMLFFHNKVDGAGNEGLQIQQQIASSATSPLLFKNDIRNTGTRNQEQHRNAIQLAPGNQGIQFFQNYVENAHNTFNVSNSTRGTHHEIFSNVIYSTGRDNDGTGLNIFLTLSNGEQEDVSFKFWNNTMVFALGQPFTIFTATGVDDTEFRAVANLFVSSTTDEDEIGGGSIAHFDVATFDNKITTDISDFEFIDAAGKDYRPATIDGIAWDTYTSFTKVSKYADYDFNGFKFTIPIGGAFSGTSTLIAGGNPEP